MGAQILGAVAYSFHCLITSIPSWNALGSPAYCIIAFPEMRGSPLDFTSFLLVLPRCFRCSLTFHWKATKLSPHNYNRRRPPIVFPS